MLDPTKVLRRLLERAELRGTGCREWCGSATDAGYGQIYVDGKLQGTHRAMFFVMRGWWPLVVRHTCDNPRCINPFHLLAGTYQDNSDDRTRRGRMPVGSALTHAKLNESKVLDMRSKYATGEYSQRNLATLFGVSQRLVGKIVRRTLWTHI